MGIVEELSGNCERIVGSKQVMKLASSRQLSKVYIAKDADGLLIEKLRQACEKHGTPYDMSCTMHQIGSAAGIEVSSACAAILKK